MRTHPWARPTLAVPACSSTQALHAPDDEFDEARTDEDHPDEDDWDALEPDPAELDEWDDALSDEDLDYGADDDDDEPWHRGEQWRDFDRIDVEDDEDEDD